MALHLNLDGIKSGLTNVCHQAISKTNWMGKNVHFLKDQIQSPLNNNTFIAVISLIAINVLLMKVGDWIYSNFKNELVGRCVCVSLQFWGVKAFVDAFNLPFSGLQIVAISIAALVLLQVI